MERSSSTERHVPENLKACRSTPCPCPCPTMRRPSSQGTTLFFVHGSPRVVGNEGVGGGMDTRVPVHGAGARA